MTEPVKNKKLTYALICVLIVVWGLIVQRVSFNELPAEDPVIRQSRELAEVNDQYRQVSDTFQLALDYRDPFTGKQNQSHIPDTVLKLTKQTRRKVSLNSGLLKKVTPLQWPELKYSGYIINPAAKYLVAIVSVNGQERMLYEGQSLQGITLLQNRVDSILISYMGKRRYIRR